MNVLRRDALTAETHATSSVLHLVPLIRGRKAHRLRSSAGAQATCGDLLHVEIKHGRKQVSHTDSTNKSRVVSVPVDSSQTQLGVAEQQLHIKRLMGLLAGLRTFCNETAAVTLSCSLSSYSTDNLSQENNNHTAHYKDWTKTEIKSRKSFF